MKKKIILSILISIMALVGCRDKTLPIFKMTIKDVFYIDNLGYVVTGKVEDGKIKTGDTVMIKNDMDKVIYQGEVDGIETVIGATETAKVGDSIALWIQDVTGEHVKTGYIIIME